MKGSESREGEGKKGWKEGRRKKREERRGETQFSRMTFICTPFES